MHKTSGDLFTTRSLDREMFSKFILIVESFDLGDPPRSSVVQLQITVLDDNDNSPVFALNHYQTTVREDLGDGSVVLELFATDADEGPNGKIMYSLLGDTSRAFTIDRVSGAVSAFKPLDRERKSLYLLKAVATDLGILGPRSASVAITVHVNDVNDNWPVFLQNPLKSYVSSQTPINQTIATVQARDADLGLNGAVNFRFVTAEAMFEIDSNTGDIFLQKPVPQQGFIAHLLIAASDQGVPVRTATALLSICSETQTEMISFSQSHYEATVTENSETGEYLAIICVFILQKSCVVWDIEGSRRVQRAVCTG